MIPVPLFSPALLITLGVSALAVLALLLWLLVLCLFRSARLWWRRHPRVSWSLLVVLLVLCIPQAYMAYVWHVVSEEMEQEEAARHPTLTEPARIRGLDVPAGTRLSLPGSHDWQAADEVEFPAPTLVHGVPALAVRFSSTWDDQAPAGSSMELPVHELRIAAPATVDGCTAARRRPCAWRCERSRKSC